MASRRLFIFFLLVFMSAILIQLVIVFNRLQQPVKEKSVEKSRISPVLSIYGFGRSKADFFMKPHDVAVDGSNNLYISDTRNARIIKMSMTGRLLDIIGKNPDVLNRPLGLDVSEDGKIYVCDREKQALLIFNRAGNLLKEVGVREPLKAKVARDLLLVSTRGSILVFDLDGNFLYHWGRFGRGEGEFAYPNGIAVDEKGNIFVSDLNNLRVQAFGPRGDLLWIKGSPPENIRQLSREFGLPSGCTIGPDGNLFLVDAFQNRIVALNASNGDILMSFGGERGDGDGQFNQPSGIAWLQNDLFAVADKYNDRIQIVKLLYPGKTTEKRKPKTLPERNIMIALITAALILAVIIEIRNFLASRRKA